MDIGDNTFESAVWQEIPSENNPFYPESSFCRGYDFWKDLVPNLTSTETLYLFLKGELATPEQIRHLNILLTALSSPGPRDHQNMAAMAAAIGGVPLGTALNAGLVCSQGRLSGGAAVEQLMDLLLKSIKITGGTEDYRKRIDSCISQYKVDSQVPGFGLFWGEKDKGAAFFMDLLIKEGFEGSHLKFLQDLEPYVTGQGGGWIRVPGVAGASLLDLGFTPKEGHGIYMYASMIGILAHSLECSEKKWNSFPTWFQAGVYQYSTQEKENEQP